jgi:pyridoxine kinase
MIAAKQRLTVLAMSSQVVRGSVGLSVIVPALQRLGHEAWPLPTILLSNHPGHPHATGVATPPERMLAMVEALHRNGWLGEIDALLTGYLPTAAHVEAAAAIVTRVRDATQRATPYLCDPVLGDDPKGLYIQSEAAAAIRDRLLPLADILTPNRFELSWLSGHEVRNEADAVVAARRLDVRCVVATSVPGPPTQLINVETWPTVSYAAPTDLLPRVPHGTGDLFSALYLAASVPSSAPKLALYSATEGVAAAIATSRDRDELTTHAV